MITAKKKHYTHPKSWAEARAASGGVQAEMAYINGVGRGIGAVLDVDPNISTTPLADSIEKPYRNKSKST
jgi:hypothetical protein